MIECDVTLRSRLCGCFAILPFGSYNTMYAVLENFDKSLTQGALMELGYELQGEITAEQTEDYLENLLVGWSTTITIDIPNTVQNCG